MISRRHVTGSATSCGSARRVAPPRSKVAFETKDASCLISIFPKSEGCTVHTHGGVQIHARLSPTRFTGAVSAAPQRVRRISASEGDDPSGLCVGTTKTGHYRKVFLGDR